MNKPLSFREQSRFGKKAFHSKQEGKSYSTRFNPNHLFQTGFIKDQFWLRMSKPAAAKENVMRFHLPLRMPAAVALLLLFFVAVSQPLIAQTTTGTIQGTVTDASGAVIPNASVTVTNPALGFDQTIQTDTRGNYVARSLPLGTYTVEVKAPGLQVQKASGVEVAVSTTTVQNFSLKVASSTEVVEVTAETPVIESSTSAVGQTIDQKVVQDIPLNGRHFVDLALLTPGTVIPPQNGFLTAPLRGQGSFGIVSAGTREDTTNFMVNGINLNDTANGQLTFNPTIATVSEFKINNQTPSAEFGRNSGAQVNIATRSGTNAFHGEAYEFLRNEALDARNYFNREQAPSFVAATNSVNFTHQNINPFKRNQFGGDLGGPIWKNHTFFFGSYEGLRQRQGLAFGPTRVPTDAERATVTNPTIQKLLTLVPAAQGGGNTFTGSAVAPVNIDQGTGDILHNFSDYDRLHGYYVFQRDERLEPNLSGANIPGGGDQRRSHRQIFTLSETHIFNPSLVNDFRVGFNRIHITFASDTAGLDPASFGINDGVSAPIGIPQIIVTGAMTFGGERNFPQGRGDLTTVVNDSVSWNRGNHGLKFGGEYRRINNNTIAGDLGSITFPSLAAFLAGTEQGFNINLGGNHPARITQPALGFFGMDSYKIKPYLTLELGLRWDWNFTPTEALNRSTVILPSTNPANSKGQTFARLVQIGTNDRSEEYHQNNKLFQPRVGFAYDMFRNGKTILRGGYAIAYDQPLPIISSGNPPFGLPLSFQVTAGPTTSPAFSNLVTAAAGGGITPTTVNPNYNDAYIQSYNLNIQQQITPTLGMMVGYFGSKGTDLNMQLNINQNIQDPTAAPGTYIRPIVSLGSDSPIIPKTASGTPVTTLNNITSNESIGTSTYNGLWVTGTKSFGHGLQFNANYTWSHSIDENSRNFQGVTVQNSLNPFADRASSDFDARHHFTFSTLYDLPFKGNRVVSGWRLGSIISLQSGNPLTIITSINTFTGVTTVRPDQIAALPNVGTTLVTAGSNVGKVSWFPNNSVCDPTSAAGCGAGSIFALPQQVVGGKSVFHFGSLGRNAVIGPDFKNMDFSISKTTKITERLSNEFRVEAFDLFNHPNFGNPGTTASVGSSTFGLISGTRNPTGDAGSSRQLQLAMKLIF